MFANKTKAARGHTTKNKRQNGNVKCTYISYIWKVYKCLQIITYLYDGMEI